MLPDKRNSCRTTGIHKKTTEVNNLLVSKLKRGRTLRPEFQNVFQNSLGLLSHFGLAVVWLTVLGTNDPWDKLSLGQMVPWTNGRWDKQEIQSLEQTVPIIFSP